MTETQLTAILSAFYRHGRRGFVPLTAEELDRAVSTHSFDRAELVRQRLVKASGKQRNPIYDITERGREIVQKHLARRA
jgi:hypothetical protein